MSQSRSSLTSFKNPSVKSFEGEDLSSERGGSNWYSLTSMVRVKKLVKPGKKRQKMGTRARQTEAKTQQKVIALFGKLSNILLRERSKRENSGKEVARLPTLSRSLQSIVPSFQKHFCEVLDFDFLSS